MRARITIVAVLVGTYLLAGEARIDAAYEATMGDWSYTARKALLWPLGFVLIWRVLVPLVGDVLTLAHRAMYALSEDEYPGNVPPPAPSTGLYAPEPSEGPPVDRGRPHWMTPESSSGVMRQPWRDERS